MDQSWTSTVDAGYQHSDQSGSIWAPLAHMYNSYDPVVYSHILTALICFNEHAIASNVAIADSKSLQTSGT